ncbi:FHA domain-containing protein [Agromyces sp. M3QZ16-3]|uniref:FHA domain-containing protein n=1 Tax=Agromyces sp. M3QZ16-3 TaxID=3447585 RepID=UPI003F68D35A
MLSVSLGETGDAEPVEAADTTEAEAEAGERPEVPPTARSGASADSPPARETAPEPSARYVLTFTTGEVVTVGGSGLVGRRPLAEPGETFDHLVQIVDRGLSVSKTHLEFGEHEGELWVADRFSANGTVVRRPGEGGVRCEPGRRVLVPRGSRVEIGEQAFVVA